jgi:glycosyltransferase involved in cell wall biosynthesis
MLTTTGRPLRVLVVIPAWNEQACVGNVVREVKATNPTADVLVVDDGSGDATARLAREAGAVVCELPFNLGVGGAMRTGYRYAVRNDYDAVVQIDADGQHQPSYVGALVDALADSNIVIGARFAGSGDYPVRGPRRVAMRVLARVLSRLAGRPLNDVTSGFRAVDRRAAGIFAMHYPAEYLGDTVESLVIALRLGCRVTQVPVEMRMRASGRSTQSTVRATLYLARALVALALALVRKWPAVLENPPEVVSLDPAGTTRDTLAPAPSESAAGAVA